MEPTGLELLDPAAGRAIRQGISRGLYTALTKGVNGFPSGPLTAAQAAMVVTGRRPAAGVSAEPAESADERLARVWTLAESVPQAEAQPPSRAVQLIAASGVRLRASVERTHWSSEAELAAYIDDYIAVTATMPEHKDLHDDAVQERGRLIGEFRERQLQHLLAEIELEIGKQRAADIAKLMEVRVPDHLRLGRSALEAAELFLRLAPGTGEVFVAVELFSAQRIDFVRMAAGEPPEKLTGWDQIRIAAQLLVGLIPLAGRIVGAGARAGAQAVLRISARTGSSPSQVLGALRRLGALQREHGLLRLAVQRAGAWVRPRAAALGMRVAEGVEYRALPPPESSLPALHPPLPSPGHGFVGPQVRPVLEPMAGLPQRPLPPVSIQPAPLPLPAPEPPRSLTSGAVFELDLNARGLAIESAMGKVYRRTGVPIRRMPKNFGGIDFISGGNTTVVRDSAGQRIKEIIEAADVISEKSIDLRTTMGSEKSAAALQGDIRKHIRDLYQFEHYELSSVEVRDVRARILNIHFGPGQPTAAQWDVINGAATYAADRDVILNIIRF